MTMTDLINSPLLDLLSASLRPSPTSLVTQRKRFLLAPVSLLLRHPSRYPIPLAPITSSSLLTTLSPLLTFLLENFLATELVAMLAISCAWICHPRSELQLRAGLAPPPWFHTWLAGFRIAHALLVNVVYFLAGADTPLVPFRVAIGMWTVGIFVVGGLVAAYVGRAMVRDAFEDWRWTNRVRKSYAMAGAAGGRWREGAFARRRREAERVASLSSEQSSATSAAVEQGGSSRSTLGGQGVLGESSRKLKRE
jgi:hypothetical protein